MKCPECGNDKTRVYTTRPDSSGESIQRYRRCSKCEATFTSYECYERADVEAPFECADIKAAVEKALVWLKQPARHIPIVRDACAVLRKACNTSSNSTQ